MGKRIDYDSDGYFMLRSPMYPVSFLKFIPDTSTDLYQWLKDRWRDPIVREGIMLGSQEFSHGLESFFKADVSEKSDLSIMYPFLRYLCRFSSRCTPFGTFAGFATGRIGEDTRIILDQRINHRVHARPDMEYLISLAKEIELNRQIREELLFFPNSTLYRVGSHWHYVEVTKPGGLTKKNYEIVTVDDGGVLNDVLTYSSEGRSLRELRDYLMGAGWSPEEVMEYVDSLTDSQVLVSNLEPVVCGPEYLEYLNAQLHSVPLNSSLVKAVSGIKVLFSKIQHPSDIHEKMKEFEYILQEIGIPAQRNHLIQTDLHLMCHDLRLGRDIAGQVLLGLRILKSVSVTNHYDVFKGFRESFIRRYGTNKVPLVNVLDPETGIGLDGSQEAYWTDPVPWIEDLSWGPANFREEDRVLPGNPWLEKRFLETIKNGEQYITINAQDLHALDIHMGTWPEQMTAIAEVFNEHADGPLNVHLLLGTSGNPAYLMGRFGFADPGMTCGWLQHLLTKEGNSLSEILMAEVVHLPEDRTGNVLQRPDFLDYEIPYLSRSCKEKEFQIPITDLEVAIEGSRVSLYSKSRGKRILPKMTNAYNHQLGSLAVYKFLNRVNLQESSHSFAPAWGKLAWSAPFVPGIRFNRLILSYPMWLVYTSDFSRWIRLSSNEVDMKSLTEWRSGKMMPDEMVWISSDQELYINWNNASLILAFWDAAKKMDFVRFRPFYFSSGSPVTGPDGMHANQFILSYHKAKER